MNNPVRIKGTKSGMIIVLDKALTFDEAKDAIKEKFESSSDFFGSNSVALAFEGKKLTDDEKYEIVDLITDISDLNIVCITENDPKVEERMNKSLNETLSQMKANTGQFYKGNLRGGQTIEFESSVVVLGDVNVGAQVVSKGNIVILGSLFGNAIAGAGGKENSFVAALNMQPTQIRIADVIARSSDNIIKPDKNGEPKIAYLENGSIYIETLSHETLNDINID